MTCPRIGHQVVLHYNRRLSESGAAIHHGQVGVVVGRMTKGKPRNHLVRLGCGRLLVVPCGNLRSAELHSAIP